LKFADTFPNHDKAAIVLGAAVDDLYELKDYAAAVSAGRSLVDNFANADQGIRRSAWLVVAHSSFELANYEDAEEGYSNTLHLTSVDDASRDGLFDNLAASIYKQGEQASKLEDHEVAAHHFLRIALVAPTSKIRPAAEYDAAAALIQLKDFERAAEVLQSFRRNYPGHELQPEVTKKVAFAYKEAGKLSLAAEEYERIETESTDDDVRRGALLLAADLYEQNGEIERALRVYKRFVEYFPSPVDHALEIRYKIATVYKTRNDHAEYRSELKRIVAIDAGAGSGRTARTRYLAATSALVIAEPLYEQFADIKLVAPLERNLERKKESMKSALDAFGQLVDYEVGEVTAAATFYLAEIYYHFSRALMESERPANLDPEELEQYELALEDEAYPFEEKAIEVHEKNLELLAIGVYNKWIDTTIERLAKLMPARYAKYEESTGFVNTIGLYSYGVGAGRPVDAPDYEQNDLIEESVLVGQALQAPGPGEPGVERQPVEELWQVGQVPAEPESIDQLPADPAELE
jgi:cellulose synthase operon protein C